LSRVLKLRLCARRFSCAALSGINSFDSNSIKSWSLCRRHLKCTAIILISCITVRLLTCCVLLAVYYWCTQGSTAIRSVLAVDNCEGDSHQVALISCSLSPLVPYLLLRYSQFDASIQRCDTSRRVRVRSDRSVQRCRLASTRQATSAAERCSWDSEMRCG
jgi:hypothetical protein